MASIFDFMANPRSHHLKKAMYEILKERYAPHDQILERISTSLTVDSDVQSFFKLITDVYESAYMKAVSDHSEQLKKMGLSAKVVAPNH